MKKKQVKFFFILLALGYSGCLYFFYLKYVPLVKPFQILLTPFLLGVFILTAISVDRGTLFFIFSFPLINSLPYFFGIFEHIPHAPTALVLFLFYFFGWIVHNISSKSDLYFNHPIFKPIILFSVMIFLSGIITFLRYANFFPFLADSIYEIITNVHGVTAGGAIMSSLFFALNYVSGFAFFFILLNTIKSIKYIRKVVIVLLISTALSLGVGFYQEFIDPGFGNTPLRVNQSIINSTFKDPLSFGAYLSAVIALVLSAVFAFKGVFRILSFLVFLSALFILPRTGSKSGFVGMAISLLFFLIFFSLMVFNRAKLRAISLKKIVVFSTLSLFVAAIIFSALFLSRESESFKRLTVLNYQQGGLRETIKVRYDQWLMAAYMLKDYPLTGVGIGAYIIELPNYWQIHKGSLREWTDSAENYFLQVGSELGLLSLFFSFWIFWEILKQMKKSWQHYPYHHKGKYIQIGVSCGIISFLLNFLVHTYIGSYEIIYTFWLLVALIFCLNGRRTSHTALATPIRKMPSLSSRAPLGCVAISLLHDEIPRCRRDDQKSRIGSRSSQ